MSDPTRPDWSDPTQAAGSGYPPNPDPAYSGQYPGYWAPPTYYGPGYSAPMTQPTEQFPSYWPPGSGYPPPAPPPPPPPKSPRWLWIVAGAAVLLVTGLVLALVIVSGSSRDSTVVAPATQTTTATSSPRLSPPTTPTTLPTPTTPRVPITTTTRLPMPSSTEEPAPSTPVVPGETTSAPSSTETVVYSVTGEGRAINITYVDTGGVMQTEFNVALPWSKEVSLSAPAKGSASVAVVNVGRDVTCSVSVGGAQVRQRTGRGLTICTGAA
jgi:hypothetical protein